MRERDDDIRLLAEAYTTKYAQEFRRNVTGISAEGIEKLMNYPWPGNVRELRNVIERAVLLSKHPVLGPDDLVLGRTDPAAGLIVVLPNEGIDLQTVEEDLLKQALARTNNNQTKAAKLLRLSRDQLRYRMERYGLL